MAPVHTVRPPKVSAIITCYNLGQYLDEAVESILAQTYQDFEILIVDDGSTDRATQALLADYRRPKTRVLRVPHGGLAAARNAGIAATTGEYLCAMDADDRFEPTYFARAAPVLDGDSTVTFASCWLRTFGDEEWEWKPERCDLPTLLLEDTVLTASLVRREAVIAAGGYDTGMPAQGDEDWDLWLTLVERGHRGVILPAVLFNYRRRANSMSTVCWEGPGHIPLTGYRLAKHGDAYRAHLVDVLLHQDVETGTLLRRNDELERDLAYLKPALVSRREELAALQARLVPADPARVADAPDQRQVSHLRELDMALESASAEVAALRASLSWRLTGPLRRVYDLWLRWWRPA